MMSISPSANFAKHAAATATPTTTFLRFMPGYFAPFVPRRSGVRAVCQTRGSSSARVLHITPRMQLESLAHTVPLVVTYAATAFGFAALYVTYAVAGDAVGALLVKTGKFVRVGE